VCVCLCVCVCVRVCERERVRESEGWCQVVPVYTLCIVCVRIAYMVCVYGVCMCFERSWSGVHFPCLLTFPSFIYIFLHLYQQLICWLPACLVTRVCVCVCVCVYVCVGRLCVFVCVCVCICVWSRRVCRRHIQRYCSHIYTFSHIYMQIWWLWRQDCVSVCAYVCVRGRGRGGKWHEECCCHIRSYIYHYRVAKTHRIPYSYRSFPAKVT